MGKARVALRATVYALWFALADGALAYAARHQLTVHTGPYEYCLAWYLGMIIGVISAIVLTTKSESLLPIWKAHPLIARFCFLSGGVAMLGLGGVFAYLGLGMLFPTWFSETPSEVPGRFWRIGLLFALVLGAMGLVGILWGLFLCLQAVTGPAPVESAESKPRSSVQG